MNYLQAVLLGALQGVTEFLPVSSSGHLVLLKQYFNLGEVSVLFDVLLHVATLGAVLIVFREKIQELWQGFIGFLRKESDEQGTLQIKILLFLLCSTVCTGIVGLPLEDLLEQASPKTVSAFLLVTAFLLILSGSRKGEKDYGSITLRDALLIGIAQGIGVLPGISRSGITIATGLLVGLQRSVAGEYSFLLSIPAILGALVLTLKDAQSLAAQIPLGVLLAGFGTAFCVGYIALKLLITLVRQGRLGWFALYLIPVGVIGILFL